MCTLRAATSGDAVAHLLEKLIATMNLPVEILPNPLITSVVEFRFTSDLNSLEVLQKMFSTLFSNLPNFEKNDSLPADLQALVQITHHPEYSLANESFKLSFGKNVISFENIAGYKLWPKYFEFITDVVTKIFNINFIKQIDRIGVRYASVIPKQNDLKSVFKATPGFNHNGIESIFDSYRGHFKVGDYNLFLQITANVNANRNSVLVNGIYVDIDASYSKPIQPGDTVLKIIDELHLEEKKFFFSLLRDDFILTLNPKY